MDGITMYDISTDEYRTVTQADVDRMLVLLNQKHRRILELEAELQALKNPPEETI